MYTYYLQYIYLYMYMIYMYMISKYNLLSPCTITCMYVFRSDYLALNKQCVLFSGRLPLQAPVVFQWPLVLHVGLRPGILFSIYLGMFI